MQIRGQVFDLFAVFLILFITLILTVDFGIAQLYYPSILLWALMPFVVELGFRKGKISSLGFQRTNFRRSFPLTLGLVMVWILTFLFVSVIRWKTPLPVESLLFVASIFFHPGLVEELCFRGFLQTRLERLLSVNRALVIQATVFGLYHLPPVISGDPRWLVLGGPFYPLIAFAFGVVLGMIYIKTRNLFVNIAFHASLLEFLLLASLLSA